MLSPNSFRLFKYMFVVFVAMAVCAIDASSVYAKKKKATYGTIKILSTPGGLPIQVDGKPFGNTTTEYRPIDLDPGLHTIVVTLPSGQLWTKAIDLPAGRIKCVTLTFRAAKVAPAIYPCPFPVGISAPSQVSEGEVITYTADARYSGSSPLRYTWTITPANARILSGEGTRTITVDSTGLAGQRIDAVLVVDDGSGEPACHQTARMSTFVPRIPPRENPARQFDVCCSCSYDDQKARLDNLAIELQNDPSTTAYIIAYGGKSGRPSEADRLATRARDYIVTQRKINPSRIVVVNGGIREDNCVELWIVPAGAKPPQPTPQFR